MLKNIQNYLLVLAIATLASACHKDLGNYEYHEINDIGFDGMDSAYTVVLGEHFKLMPELILNTAGKEDTSAYEYEWISYNGSVLAAYQERLLATTRNLDQIITLSPGNYKIYYRVTDKQSGVQYQTIFDMEVISSIYEGWMVLSDVNGQARLDMVSRLKDEDRVYQDVLARTGSHLQLQGVPVDITCYAYDPRMYGIYVTATESGTNKIDPESFDWESTYNLKYEMLGSVPEDFRAGFVEPLGGSASYMYAEHNIYYYFRVYQIRYGLPINIMPDEAKPFKAAPFIAPDYFGSSIFYDTDAKRFVRHTSGNAKCSEMPEGTLFDYTTGKDLVYMAYSDFGSGGAYAILKNDAGTHWLARFTTGNEIVQTYYDTINVADITMAENFAVSPNLGYIFYNVGSKVYEYDMSLRQSKLMVDKGGHEISLMKFYGDQLVVCSYDPARTLGANGKMEFYTVPPVNGDLQLDKTYEGFGKIVDFDYRQR